MGEPASRGPMQKTEGKGAAHEQHLVTPQPASLSGHLQS